MLERPDLVSVLPLRREDAEQFVAECLADESEWADVLSVEPIELEFVPN